jgi:hypothetical protein
MDDWLPPLIALLVPYALLRFVEAPWWAYVLAVVVLVLGVLWWFFGLVLVHRVNTWRADRIDQ